MHATCGVVAFSHHLHFHHGGFHRVAFANHGAEVVVAAEARVASHQQVAQIHRVADVARWVRAHHINKAFHFANAVAHKRGEEVVAVFHAVQNAGANGVDVFEHAAIFDAFDVA